MEKYMDSMDLFSSICKITDCEGSSIIIKAFLCKRSLPASYWVTTPKGVGKENGNVLDSGWMDYSGLAIYSILMMVIFKNLADRQKSGTNVHLYLQDEVSRILVEILLRIPIRILVGRLSPLPMWRPR